MTRARDIADLGSAPPLTNTLGTEFVQNGTVTDVVSSNSSTLLWASGDVYDAGVYGGIAVYHYSGFSPEVQTLLQSVSVGDTITFSISTGTHTLSNITSIPYNSSTDFEAYGTWDTEPEFEVFSFEDTYLLSESTALATDCSPAAITSLTQLVDGYVVGSTTQSGGAANGSSIEFNTVRSGISVGDPVGYWNTPTALSGRTSSGVDNTLGFDSVSGRWVYNSNPLSVHELNMPPVVDNGSLVNWASPSTTSYFGLPTPATYTITRPNPTSVLRVEAAGLFTNYAGSGSWAENRVSMQYSFDGGATYLTDAVQGVYGSKDVTTNPALSGAVAISSWSFTNYLMTDAPTVIVRFYLMLKSQTAAVKHFRPMSLISFEEGSG